MIVKPVSEKQKEAFNKVACHPLQSWEWGEFRKKAGNKVVRLGVFENGKPRDAIQIIFSLIPHTNLKIGTVIKGPFPTKEILAALKILAKEENTVFIKMEPNFAKASLGKAKFDRLIKLLKSSGCVPGKRLFTPTSFWIDLTKSEEELLKSFHPKTRYNIRLAEKSGVKIIEDNSDKAFEKYLELTSETVIRQGFFAHTRKYHQLMWQTLHKELIVKNKRPIARLLTAKYNPPATPERSDGGRGNEIITTWIVFVWHDFLYYPYGASTDKYKGVMANNLIMWEAIKYGKKLGLKTFDLWGREEGKGFTKFKEGYNPKIVEFLGSWDLIISPLYWPYRIVENLRWTFLRVPAKLGLIKPRF
jgi:lipid II:glycine glycyltransferase (peptidoglycan interpeptide bridge formation enzyme)